MSLLQRDVPVIGLTTAHSKVIFGFATTCFVLATVAVLLRVYARRLKRKSLVTEDYLVFLALLAFFAQTIMDYFVIFLGAAGHPQKDVSPKNVRASLQILAGQGVCYGFAMTSSKLSICLLYKRIFAVRPFRIATYVIMSIIFAWGVLASTVTWAWCVPIEYGWDITIPGGHCANRNAGYLAVGVIDAVTDLFILILPLPMIYRLQIPRMKQVSLAIIFSIAITSIIVSAMRAYYTSIIVFDDFTDSRSLLDVFSAIEPATSIIVASSFVLGPVLKKWFGHEGPDSQPPSAKHNFQRINDTTRGGKFQSSRDIELGGTVTAVQGPKWATLAAPPVGTGQMERRLDETQLLAVQEGKGISVLKDFSIHQEK